MKTALEAAERQAQPPIGLYKPRGRSKLAECIAQMDPKVRISLKLNDYVVAFLDFSVTMSAVIVGDDTRPLQERLDELDGLFAESDEQLIDADEASSWIASAFTLVDKVMVDRWARRVKSPLYKKFLNRLLGTANYSRVSEAFQADSLVVLSALQRGVAWLMPFAVALQDCIGGLTEKQLDEARFLEAAKASFLGLLMQLDAVLDGVLAAGLPISLPAREQVETKPDEMERLAIELRQIVSAQSNEHLSELDAFLARKLRGARDALQFSEDGVSQAANSLIELIDRLARQAFDDESVLTWIDQQAPVDTNLWFTTAEGKRRPTKRAQLLCLAYAGEGIDDPARPAFHRVVAAGLAIARERLQRLKHADTGAKDDRDAIEEMLAAVEGALFFLVRVCWAIGDQSKLKVIRERIGN